MKLTTPRHQPRILVTSAAGRTGIPTTLQLLEKGYPVRALVRREDHRSRLLRNAGAEVVVGNLADMRDLRTAMKGVSRAYFCAPTAPNALHYATAFAIAAREAEIEHVVTLSQWLSHDAHPSVLTREVWMIDQIIPQISGATQTLINVGWFAANYFFVLEPIAQLGVFPLPLGEGLNAPPSNEDIARVIVGSLDRPDLHAGKTYRPTGPTLLTPVQIVDHIGRALGRTVKYRPVSERMFLKSMRADGWPEAMQTQLILYLEEYRRNAFGIGAPTDAVKVVSGREPEDFQTIARRYAAMPEAAPTLRNRIKAVSAFARSLATRPIDPSKVEADRDHALITDAQFAPQSAEWVETHRPRSSETATTQTAFSTAV